MYVLTAAGLTGFALGTGPVLRTWDYHLASPYMLLFAFGWAVCSADRSQARAAWVKTFAAAGLVWFVALTVADPADSYLLFRMSFAAGVFVLARVMRPLLQRDIVVNRAASAIGDASYSLYLSHWFVLSALGKLLGALHFSPAVDWTARLVGFAAAILFALACFRYVEDPLDRFLRPRMRRSKTAVPLKDLSPARSGYFVVPLESEATRHDDPVASCRKHEGRRRNGDKEQALGSGHGSGRLHRPPSGILPQGERLPGPRGGYQAP
jgi:peptidoglycan/LPS O-acetylase OafA/YrhL